MARTDRPMPIRPFAAVRAAAPDVCVVWIVTSARTILGIVCLAVYRMKLGFARSLEPRLQVDVDIVKSASSPRAPADRSALSGTVGFGPRLTNEFPLC